MSQLYARVFVQILDSSIAEDFTLRHVFEDFMKLCDYKTGELDMTRHALARRLNIPLDLLNEAIKKLESPDPASRDPEFEGRRIERLDRHRDWGWRILNWEKYENIRNRASGAERAARFRAKRSGGAVAVIDENPHKASNNGDARIKSIQDQKLAETIYEAYPRKVARPEAIKAILKALAKVPYEELLEKTKAFASASSGQVEKYIPHPSTFYNQERYNDPVKNQTEQSMATEIISCVYMKKIPEERRMEPTPIDVPVRFFSDGSPDLGSIPSDPIEIRMAVEDRLIAMGRMV